MAVDDPVSAYADAVVAGQIETGRLVRLACLRHQRDAGPLGRARGLKFKPGRAARALLFFERWLSLSEGEHAGKPFRLEPFQKFIVGSLFGWTGADGYRRFRTAYIEIGKGNGKSPLAAGIGLYGLVADREAGAEIYSAATQKDQAKILFRDAENMVAASGYLTDRVERSVNNLAVIGTNSFFRPISSEKKGLDGKRVHMALIDEIHEHPSALVVDKMRAGTKGRRQALIVEITNSGFNRESVCFYHHNYSRQILEQTFDNDSWFAYVCGLDPCEACRSAGLDMPKDDCPDCDNWRDEAKWIKANPCLDISITRKYLREQVAEAMGMPSKINIVRRLNFCAWTQTDVRWLPLDDWDICSAAGLDRDALAGRECYGGLDLASTDDITALILAFPQPGRTVAVLPFFWLPEAAVYARFDRNMVPYPDWVRGGFITVTPGEIADYDRIRADINDIFKRYAIKEIGYDRWGATQLVTQLGSDGLVMLPVGQGYASMSAPSKDLEQRVRSHRLLTGGNPVLRWMAGNCAAELDPAGNIKPSKARSTEKIDGIVALVMALSRYILTPEAMPSIYETRGLDSIRTTRGRPRTGVADDDTGGKNNDEGRRGAG